MRWRHDEPGRSQTGARQEPDRSRVDEHDWRCCTGSYKLDILPLPRVLLLLARVVHSMLQGER